MKFKTSILLATAVVTTLGGGALSSHNVVNVFGNSKVYAATSRDITITGETFPDYFQSNGSAAVHPYDEVNYIQTLTDDATYLAGNVTLTTKVDMSQSFSFKGEVNLGNKSKQDGGADGIGFLFHPGDTDVVGAIGGAAGIGGVQGAFGFKLDTYYNGTSESSFMADPDIYSASKSATKTDESFGAFVDGTDGVAKTIEKGSLTIPQPTDNQFLPFEIVYDGTTETMTVTYNGETWEKNVKEFMGDETAMSFSIAASTGGNKNLQQLKNVTFTYTIAQGTVVSHFVDEDGNPILDADGNPISEEESGDLNTPWSLKPKEIPGYTFKEVKDNEPTEGTYTANDQEVTFVYTRNVGQADVTYIDDTTGKTLTTKDLSGGVGTSLNYATADTIKSYTDAGYVLVADDYPTQDVQFTEQPQHYEVHLKHDTTEGSEEKEVKETIHYVFENGDLAKEDYQATPITFSRSYVMDKVTGEKTYGEWKAVNGNQFDEVASPEIKGYTPDQDKVSSIPNVTVDMDDIEKTVTYKRNPGSVVITYIDDTTNKVLEEKELTGEVESLVDYTTADRIKYYIDKGFVLVSDGYPESEVTFTEDGQKYIIHLKHDEMREDEEKIVNETIHYVFENGESASEDYVATPIKFSRTVTTDKVTGEKTYGAWQAENGNQFAEVVSPKIKGYSADQSKIDAITGITPETGDIEKTVVYTKDTSTTTLPPVTFPDSGNPSLPDQVIDNQKTEEFDFKSDDTADVPTSEEGTEVTTEEDNLPTTGENISKMRLLSTLGVLLLTVSAMLYELKRRIKKQ